MKKLTPLLLLLVLPSLCIHAQEIPDTKIFKPDGSSFQTSVFNLKDNKLIVLSFWATWCIPCITELTAINDNSANWKKELSFQFYAVATDDARTKSRVEPLVNGKGWDFEILLDKNQDFKRLLNLSLIPYTLVIKNGKIIYRRTGYVPGDENKLYEILKSNQ